MNSRKEREKKIHNKFFNKHAREKLSAFYSIAESSTSFYKNLLLENCYKKKILEYGCGTGGQSFFLARNGAEVTGIDISEEGIKQAIKKTKIEYKDIENKLNFLVMDAEKMALESSSFDIVCGSGILHHLDLDLAFKEIRRVLKPTGKGIFIEPLGYNPILNLFRRITPHLRTPDEHPFLMKDVKNAYNYFGKVDVSFFHFFSFLAMPLKSAKIFYPLLEKLDKADKILFKIIPPLKLMAWTIVLVFSDPKRKNF